MLFIHTWHSGHNMVDNSNILVEKENWGKGDIPAAVIGTALGGPFGAAAGLATNRIWKWARKKYLDKQKNKDKDTQAQQATTKTQDNKKQPDYDEELKQKVKKAQDEIRNTGMFEPEVYESHKFYKSTIYDERDPENNNFVYISKAPNTSSGAYKSFLDYWTNKWAEERGETSDFEKHEYRELVKDRFPMEADKECLITVPQYFLIGANDVLSMAKNSDILDNEGVIYYDKPSFDSNFVYDTHMSQYKKEDVEEPNADQYKVSFVKFKAYGRNYDYAFDYIPGKREPDKEAEKVILDLGQEIVVNSEDDTLYAFTKFCEQMIDDERRIINVYTVATPLLRKYSTKAEDLEYNAALLDGIGIYETEEEFIKNYMEDYQKLLENQMKA